MGGALERVCQDCSWPGTVALKKLRKACPERARESGRRTINFLAEKVSPDSSPKVTPDGQ
jgi:hypothetical protein